MGWEIWYVLPEEIKKHESCILFQHKSESPIYTIFSIMILHVHQNSVRALHGLLTFSQNKGSILATKDFL
jgi:hypothetical protein